MDNGKVNEIEVEM